MVDSWLMHLPGFVALECSWITDRQFGPPKLWGPHRGASQEGPKLLIIETHLRGEDIITHVWWLNLDIFANVLVVEILLPGPADWIHRRFSPANHYFWRFTSVYICIKTGIIEVWCLVSNKLHPTWQWKIMDFLHHLIGFSQLPDSYFPTFTNLQLGSMAPPASGATCRRRARRVGLAVSATPNANRKVYTTHFW